MYDDLTFYKILCIDEKIKKHIKVNIYDFKCVGLRYKNFNFKQNKLKGIECIKKKDTKYCYSAGAYALKILNDSFLEDKIKPTVIPKLFKTELRKAYTGGRNEFIKDPTEDNLFSIDFNKMYFSCLKSKFLSGEIIQQNATTVDKPGFYYIKYESINFKYPILFQRNNYNEQNYFCNGVGEGIFWYEELLLFVKEGGLIHKIYYYYTSSIYTEIFADFILKIDKNNNEKYKKLLANNLYGKLAMKDYYYEYDVLNELEFLIKNEMKRIYR